jgi:hypothetical protein
VDRPNLRLTGADGVIVGVREGRAVAEGEAVGRGVFVAVVRALTVPLPWAGFV